MEILALPGRVLVSDIQKGERTVGSIILPNDNGKSHGIRDRWAQVYSIGDGVTDLQVGDWLLIKHGRWTRGVVVKSDQEESLTVWQVDYPDGVIAVSDKPYETFAHDHVIRAQPLERERS